MDTVNETMTTYTDEGLQTDEQNSLDETFQWSTRHDGWWATVLLGSLIFGPTIVFNPTFPPFRFVDIVILFMLFTRGLMSLRFYGGFIFSYRIRSFSLWMFALTLAISFSMMVNVIGGRYPFFYKDLFIPIVFVRMVLIAFIASTFNLQSRQVRQIMIGVTVISIIMVVLAFAQRARLFGVGPLFEKLYSPGIGQLLGMKRFEVTEIRAIGTLGNPNVFGGCLVMLAATALAFAVNLPGVVRYVSIGVFLALSATIMIATASRTALIGLLLVSSLSLILSMRRGSRLFAFLLIIMLLVLLALVRRFVYELPLGQRVKDIIGGEGIFRAESFIARWRMWTYSLSLAKESLLVGLGATKTWQQLTDNGYLFMLLRAGIIGLSIYVLWLLSLFIHGMKALRLEHNPFKRAVLLALIMVLVNHSVFEITGEFFWNIRYASFFVAFMGMLCALSKQTELEHQEGKYEQYYD